MRSACSYRPPNQVWAQVIHNLALAQLAHSPRLVAVGGGCPIVEDGVVIGGLGLWGLGGPGQGHRRGHVDTQLGFTAT
ncbi:heme-binding protein [Streptomyces sp. TLI_171]|uniref:heme-binding protein n=1 Tax=Streptomyces sp. TLI_171 TaxID=1938859 RepID=UPI00217EBCCD